jgi:ADP-dependent NAD(P)H-hydrate dehydratase
MLELTSDVLRQMPLPDPREGDKKARGDVLVIGGSVQVPGAPLLAGTAALRAGAGRLRVATCRVHATLLGLSIPQALVLGVDESPNGGIVQSAAHDLLPLIDGADAVLIGPGLSDQDAIDALTADIFENTKGAPRFVLDARALQSLGRPDIGIGRHAGRLVLTPHAGEMAGLLGKDRSEIEADPARYARYAADRFRAVVALKGAQTFVASPAGNSCVCCEGNVGLATSGSGDVLAGIIAGLLARGTEHFAAACWGVYLHAVAGANLARSIGPLGFLAREISREIPHLMAELER